MKRYFLLLLCCGIFTGLSGQGIRVDEDLSDWTDDIPVYNDIQDNNRLDILSLAISDDSEYLYFKIELDKEILIQIDHQLTLNIVSGNNNLSYNLGEREGIFFRGFSSEVYHSNIGLVVSPTVSSKVFEIRLNKEWVLDGTDFTLEGDIQISLSNNEFGGDELPNNNQKINYTLSKDQLPNIPSYSFDKAMGTDFRFCSYNVLFDRLFESETRTEYASLLTAINPDIICFQEIYDHSSQQTQNRLLNVFGCLDNSYTWYNSKRGNDNIIISRFPIIFERSIAGNGVFVLDINGAETLIINIHLPCCERDSQREEEIDAILAFIRDVKEGNTNYLLKENSPIIIAGDANFVGNADQVEALLTGHIFDNNIAGPDFKIDWDLNGLTDLKPFASGSNSLHTFYNPFGSFSKGRLDYTFYSDYTLTALNSFSLDTETLTQEELGTQLLEPYYSSFASDHFPIVVDFRMNFRVATEEIAESQLQVWPNPTSGLLFLDSAEPLFAELYSREGALIMKAHNTQLDLSLLSSGIYFLKLTDQEGNQQMQKIVKEY